MWKVLNHIRFVIPTLLLALIILVIPQLNYRELMDSTQSGKAFGFLWGMLGYLVIVLFIAAVKREIVTIRITIVDLLLGAYGLLVVISYWLHPGDPLQMLTFGALTLFYLSVRLLNHKYLIMLLVAVAISGAIQAIYGNFQLWGYYPSNHGIFRMTGSFFNPGPYAGYLAAVFPVSLGFYLFNDPVSISVQNPYVLKLISFGNRVKFFFNRIPFISRFFYNNSNEGNTPEKQAERLRHTLDSIVKSLILFFIIVMCLVLPASRSRAAWLAVMVSAGYLLCIKYLPLRPLREWVNTPAKRFFLVSSLVVLLISIGAGLYYLKKGSADGRLLIWKVSAQMINAKPILGHGASKFAVDYMNYQAAFFKPAPDVPESLQADNVTYAYNEFLKLTVEYGLVGLLLALAVLWSLFFVKIDSGENNGSNLSLLAALGGLLSVIVFALFSYPSDILPIRMLLVLFMAIVAGHQSPLCLYRLGRKETASLPSHKAAFVGKAVLYATLAVALMAVYPTTQYLTRQYLAYQSWKDASDIYNVGAYPECLDDFKRTYPLLKTNGAFLVQYGKALEMSGMYESSIAILNEAKQHLNNTILYTCLGNNYKALGNTTEAEQADLHAFNMAPARFYPLYQLAKLYDETGQKEKAVAMAKKVMGKEVKIESTAIKEIREEMKMIVDKSLMSR